MTDFLSRGAQRNELLLDLEKFIIRAELMQDYPSVLSAVRPYVRLVYGGNLDRLKEVGDVLDSITPFIADPIRSTDPAIRSNQFDSRREALKRLQNVLNEAHVAAHTKDIKSSGRSVGGVV